MIALQLATCAGHRECGKSLARVEKGNCTGHKKAKALQDQKVYWNDYNPRGEDLL
jgi:hypothetical protein